MTADRTPRWRYRPMDWLMVRTPLLAATARSSGTDAVPLADLALWIGSEALWEALHRAAEDGGRRPGSLVKARRYLDRMSHRPTPYGLFAGVALGAWGPHTDTALRRMPGRIRTRMDMGWLMAFVEALEDDPLIRRQLSFAVHSAAMVASGRLYLIDPPSAAAATRTGCLSLRASRPVLALLEACRDGASHRDLVAAICAAVPSASDAKAEGLIDQLRRAGVLLSDLQPPLTVPDPGRYVADRLATIVDPAGRPRGLSALIEEANRCDRLTPEAGLPARRRLAARARDLVPDTAPAFQTDATADLSGVMLHRAVGREAARAAEILLRTAARPPRTADSTSYRADFELRFGRHRQVPLLELVNPHLGLGFPEPQPDPPAAGLVRDQTFLSLAAHSNRSGRRVVELDERTLSLVSRPPGTRDLPATLELLVEVAAASTDAIDAGAFKVVVAPTVGARAAGRTLGRFAFLLGDKAARATRTTSSRTADTIDADIVYRPLHARAGNVAVCPASSSHLVPIGVTIPDLDRPTISLADLTVGLDGDSLAVRWGVTGQRVTFHSPHMLNATVAPRLVTFLLQLSGTTALWPFDWGAAGLLPFLPRVEHGRAVLSLARWRLDRSLMPTDRQGFRSAFDEFRSTWSLPDAVYLAEHDTRVTVHPDDAEDLAEIRRRLLRTGALTLQERYPDPAEAWLPGPDGAHVAEIVVPVALTIPPGTADSGRDRRPPPRTAHVARFVHPGSDWVYAKIYAPTVHHDDLLAGPIHDLVADRSHSGMVTGWHFLRYADPLPHLRLRFRLSAPAHWSHVATAVADAVRPALRDGTGHRLTFDTYEREIERYGGPQGMEVAESVFSADSRAALALIRGLVCGWLTINRTSLAVISVDALLAELGLPAADREGLASQMAGDRTGSAAAFRESKDELRALLTPAQLAAHKDGPTIQRVLDTRRRTIAGSLDMTQHMAGWYPAATDVPASLMHMHCNRVLGVERVTERLVYGLIARTIHSIHQWPT